MNEPQPIFHGAPLSPFVRKVAIVLAMKRVEHTFNMVLPFDKNEIYDRINPMRKIPMYEDGELNMSDSTVIIDYLENRHPQPAIYPQSPASRARALWYEEYADTCISENMVRSAFFERVVKPAMMNEAPDEEKVAHAINEVMPRHLDFLEGRLGDRPFFVDDVFSIADLSLSSMFINARYGDYMPDAKRWPSLAAWMARVEALPEMQAQLDAEAKVLAGMRGN